MSTLPHAHKLVVPQNILVGQRSLVGGLLSIARELKRRDAHPGNRVILDWDYSQGQPPEGFYAPDDHPQRPQRQFHKSDVGTRMVIGGNRTGKSLSLAWEIKWWAERSHPWLEVPEAAQIYVVSANYQTLRRGIYEHLLHRQRGILFPWDIEDIGPIRDQGVASWVKLKNGSHIEFLSGGGPEARKILQAAAIHMFVADEEIEEPVWDEGTVRLMTHGGKGVIGATPWQSEQWFLDLEDRADFGDADVRKFCYSLERAVECGHADRKRFEERMATSSKESIEVRVYGQTRRRTGLIYPEFNSEDHIIDGFSPPAEWPRFCAIDPGIDTAAVLWCAVSPDDHVYFYRELYLHGRAYHVLAARLHLAEGYRPALKTEELEALLAGELQVRRPVWVPARETERVDIRWIDPSAFRMETSGRPGIGDLLVQPPYNLVLHGAFNDVEVGIESVKRNLAKGMDGQPRFLFFRDLQNLFKEIRSYKTRRSPSGKITIRKEKDHLMDCLRYIAAGNPEYRFEREPDQQWQQVEQTIRALGATFDAQETARRLMRRQHHQRPAGQHAGGLGSIW